MKKLIYLVVLFLSLFIMSCENEETEDFIFKMTDDGYCTSNYTIIIHHPDHPDNDPLVTAEVQMGGTVTIKETSIEGDIISSDSEIDLGSIENDLIVTYLYHYVNGGGRIVTDWDVKKGSDWTIKSNYNPNNSDNPEEMVAFIPDNGEITNILESYMGGCSHYTNEVCDITLGDFDQDFVKEDFFDKTDFVAIGVGQDEEPLLATSANITWENCSSFLVNNWQYDAFYDMNVPYTTNVPNLDWVRGYNANYSANEYGYEYYNNNYTYNYDLASNGMFTLRATSQIPFANKKRVSVTTRTTDPYFSYSYTSHYNNYVPGDFVVVNPLEFSFTVNEETGDISDIVAESRIDQIDFSYRMSKNDYSYYWVHYLDPQVRNEITLPKLNMGFTNDLDWYYSPRAVDYNIYDSMDDILNALFVNNTHRGSSYTYSYSFYSIPFSSTSRFSNHIIIREEQDPYGMQRY